VSDEDGGDRLLTLFGVALALFIVVGVVGVVIAGMSGPSGDAAAAPEVDWSFERVNASHVRLVHRGGPGVPASDLVVTADGVRRRVSWTGVVSEGDAGLVRADRGVLVQLYWTTDTGERVKLAAWGRTEAALGRFRLRGPVTPSLPTGGAGASG
jgi:hypothetical protein